VHQGLQCRFCQVQGQHYWANTFTEPTVAFSNRSLNELQPFSSHCYYKWIGHYQGDLLGGSDASNELGIDADTEGKERKEMNQKPKGDTDFVENRRNVDVQDRDRNVMESSHIDHDTIINNPYAMYTENMILGEESINDLSTPHELSDNDADQTEIEHDLEDKLLISSVDNEVSESDVNSPEVSMDHSNRVNAELQKSVKKLQQQLTSSEISQSVQN
jgi:hypothetical protein